MKMLADVANENAKKIKEFRIEESRRSNYDTRVRTEGLAEVAKGLAQGAKEKAELRREIEAMHRHKETQKGIVELNIGGFKYTASVETLRRISDTFFDAYFGGRYSQDVCADSSIFIDRDGEHFGHILEYMRDGIISVLELEAAEMDIGVLRWLKRELAFYCIVAEKKDQTVFAVGWCNGYAPICVDPLDAASGTWKPVAQMRTPRTSFGFKRVRANRKRSTYTRSVHAHTLAQTYNTYTHAHTHTLTYTHTYTHTHTLTHTHTHTNTTADHNTLHTQTHRSTRTHTSTHKHTQAHAHTQPFHRSLLCGWRAVCNWWV
jgi:hypothetical protein